MIVRVTAASPSGVFDYLPARYLVGLAYFPDDNVSGMWTWINPEYVRGIVASLNPLLTGLAY